jgi:peptide deformylase
MAKLNLVPEDDPILSKDVKASGKLTKKQKRSLSSMVKKMDDLPHAIALAANQVGFDDLRAFVYRSGDKVCTVLDPVIRWSSLQDPDEILEGANGEAIPKSSTQWEGCLSCPDKEYLVIRPTMIKVEFTSESGARKRDTLFDLAARIFCHEMDHLDGVLIKNVSRQSRDPQVEEPIEATSPMLFRVPKSA